MFFVRFMSSVHREQEYREKKKRYEARPKGESLDVVQGVNAYHLKLARQRNEQSKLDCESASSELSAAHDELDRENIDAFRNGEEVGYLPKRRK